MESVQQLNQFDKEEQAGEPKHGELDVFIVCNDIDRADNGL